MFRLVRWHTLPLSSSPACSPLRRPSRGTRRSWFCALLFPAWSEMGEDLQQHFGKTHRVEVKSTGNFPHGPPSFFMEENMLMCSSCRCRQLGKFWPVSWTAGFPPGWVCLLWRSAGWRWLSHAIVSWTRCPAASAWMHIKDGFIVLQLDQDKWL